MRNWKTLLFVSVTAITACFGVGKIVIRGSVGGRTIDPQTAFAFLIDKTYESTDGKFVLRPLPPEEQTLVIQLDGANYDPHQDVRFLSADEKLRIAQEQQLNGNVRVVIGAAGKLGATLDTSTDVARSFPQGQPPTEPTIASFSYNFAAAEISKEEMPQNLPPIGTKRKFTVKLDKIGKKSGDVTAGKITLEFKKTENADPADAQEGTIELELEADHVGQRVGQCNPSDPRDLDNWFSSHGNFGSTFGPLYEECEDYDEG